METSPARAAPLMPGDSATMRTRAATASGPRWSAPAGSASPENTPARMAPRSRMWRVTARVSTSAMATTPWEDSSSSSPRLDLQFEGRRAASRTTKPATQMRADSGSSSLTPVLPMCGAVITTIWRWYEGSVRVSW